MMNEEERRLVDAYNVTPKARAVGCEHCANTGYLGRLPVMEVVTTTPALEQMVAEGASPAALREAATAAGTRPMIFRAVERIRSGDTTLAEVDRVFGEMLPHRAAPSTTARVLVVSEDPRVRADLAATLEQNGCEVAEATNADAAMAQLNKPNAVSLVVLDLCLQDDAGRQLLDRIKSSAVTHRLPILVLMGAPDLTLAAELLEAGADDFVPRPWTPELLAARTLAALRRRAR
jgi:PleD family two-component response regulator